MKVPPFPKTRPRLRPGRRLILYGAMAAWIAFAAAHAAGAVKTLVIGDSLSREYALEFPVLFPGHPDAWDARNWVEILREHRGEWLDFGGDTAPFEYNYAIPGHTAAGYRDDLDDSDGFVLEEIIFRGIIDADIVSTDRAVVFLGGNDLDQAYGGIYNGADPTSFISATANHIAFIVDYVRSRAPSTEIVVVNVPHLGVTPDIQNDYPTDPVRTGRVTTALIDLSAQLEAVAAVRGIAFADVLTPTLDLLGSAALCIGCVEIDKGINVDADPRWLFPGDGFHPNTPGQALFANEILDALNRTYSVGVPLLSNVEILEQVLGIPRNLPYREWIESFPVELIGMNDDPERDRVVNIVEYVLGLDPSRADRHLLPIAETVVETGVVALQVTAQPRRPACPCWAIVPEQSADLLNWAPLPDGNVTYQPDGSITATVSTDAEQRFLRFSVESAP